MQAIIKSRAAAANPVSTLRRNFSFYHNLHHPPFFYVNGIKYINDYDLEEYKPQVQAFITRRRVVKREIPPKVSILEDMGPQYRHVYYQQRLANGEYLYDDKHMKRLYSNDGINTQFLHSMWCEDYEKNLVDEVLQKRVTNGSVVPFQEKAQADKIKKNTDHWLKTFYKGEPLTDLELDIERMYLSGKLSKN